MRSTTAGRFATFQPSMIRSQVVVFRVHELSPVASGGVECLLSHHHGGMKNREGKGAQRASNRLVILRRMDKLEAAALIVNDLDSPTQKADIVVVIHEPDLALKPVGQRHVVSIHAGDVPAPGKAAPG